MDAQLSPRKKAMVTFQQMVAEGQVDEAYSTYIAPGFRHHNAHFPGDAASLAEGMKDSAARFPGKTFEVQRVLEDGDLVAVHSRVRMSAEGPDVILVHIGRFEGDLIAEMWDVGALVPEDSPNENGVF